jgi:hypothetical protein
MVWTGICHDGLTQPKIVQGTLNVVKYGDDILGHIVLSCLQQRNFGHVFQHDNARCHVVRVLVGCCSTRAQVHHAAPVVFPVGGEHVYRVHPINVQLMTDPVIMLAKKNLDVILVQKILTNTNPVTSCIVMLNINLNYTMFVDFISLCNKNIEHQTLVSFLLFD